jgi:hypothetical protein
MYKQRGPDSTHEGGVVAKRVRLIWSVKQELLSKSREAALAAVQIFNSPGITFKSETFIVLMIIAWTYLLHAYYRSQDVEYRYCTIGPGGKRRFDRTRSGAYKYWECEKCLESDESPLDPATKENLKFLIGLRHEIEHQMTTRIDDLMSARFQAACLNYNEYIRRLFGNEYGIDKHLAFSLQFSTLSEAQVDLMKDHSELPPYITRFVETFDNNLDESIFQDQHFAYRVLFVQKTANRKGQADRVIEFVSPDSEIAKNTNEKYVVLKETEKPKYLPSQIVEIMQDKGFMRFGMHDHIVLWKSKDAKNPALGYGVTVGGTWYWYQSWLGVVEKYCDEHRREFV